MLLSEYKNGNATIKLYDDGTKIMETDDDEFDFEFASSMDVCISERCDNGCQFCYANCTPDGKVATFNWDFLNGIPAGVEMAINMQFPLPDGFEEFLKRMKDQGVIVNATVNQRHFERHEEYIAQLVDEHLLWGIGISLVKATPEFINAVKRFDNAVIHVINGVVTMTDLLMLGGKGLKLLILGYKDKGRGVAYHSQANAEVKRKQEMLRHLLPIFLHMFEAVSFDNLALKQLDVRRLVTDDEWEEFYMGKEASSSFYINLVNGTYSPSSLDTLELPIGNLSVKEMFHNVKGRSALEE